MLNTATSIKNSANVTMQYNATKNNAMLVALGFSVKCVDLNLDNRQIDIHGGGSCEIALFFPCFPTTSAMSRACAAICIRCSADGWYIVTLLLKSKC